jgi:hypothetical protein
MSFGMVLAAGIAVEKAIKAVRDRGDIVWITTRECKSQKEKCGGKCPKKCPSELGCAKVVELTRLWLKDFFGGTPPSFFSNDIAREILEAKTVEELTAETIEKREERLRKKFYEELRH